MNFAMMADPYVYGHRGSDAFKQKTGNMEVTAQKTA
jgi:hypothetical protein